MPRPGGGAKARGAPPRANVGTTPSKVTGKPTTSTVTVASVLRATTHYSVLKLTAAAVRQKPKSSVKQAFKKASLRVHPDKSKHPRAGEAFVKLREAYRVLLDPDLRHAYDSELRTRKQAAEAAKTAAQESVYRPMSEAEMQREAHEREAKEKAQQDAIEKEQQRKEAQVRKDERHVRNALHCVWPPAPSSVPRNLPHPPSLLAPALRHPGRRDRGAMGGGPAQGAGGAEEGAEAARGAAGSKGEAAQRRWCGRAAARGRRRGRRQGRRCEG
jgi:hypothetical protein